MLRNRFYTDGSSDQRTQGGYSCLHLQYTSRHNIAAVGQDRHNIAAVGQDRHTICTYYGKLPPCIITNITLLPTSIILGIDDTKYLKPNNQRAELLGVLVAAKIISDSNLYGSAIITDSKYCISIYEEWLTEWKRDNRMNMKNMDIIILTDSLLQGTNTKFEHQPGHVKNPTTLNEIMNNKADKYAVLGRSLTEYTGIKN